MPIKEKMAAAAGFRSALVVFNFISAPPDCFDIFGMFDGIPHFFTQVPDMDGDRVIFPAVIFILPDGMKQFFGADNAAFFTAQDLKHRKFGGRQL